MDSIIMIILNVAKMPSNERWSSKGQWLEMGRRNHKRMAGVLAVNTTMKLTDACLLLDILLLVTDVTNTAVLVSEICTNCARAKKQLLALQPLI